MANGYEQTEWLGLVDITGPFLAGVVLKETFPQGLEKIQTPRRQHLRSAYEEWDDARDQSDPDLDELHTAWTHLVLEHALEFEDQVLSVRANGDEAPCYEASAQGEVYRPDYVVTSLEGEPLLFITVYPPGTDLDQPLSKGWAASAIERMKLLCRSEGVRVGLITNGEEWTLVNAPADDTSGHTTWFARNWWLEPITFRAFVSLLGVRRFFGPSEERLDQLLQRSLKEHHEVTDTLGEQVRRAVEVLIQALGRADEDRNGELLKGVAPAELYNAGLTTMMRLVFLLCAEERELLLLGDPVYDQHYAISTLRAKLREDTDKHGLEVQERRYDAWSRLLSLFRAVYGGIEHESLRMPAMGGSLFDPDRFPFLEGRAKASSWREAAASPLPIDNRTVMLLLRALQVLEHRGGARQLSYRGLDVEQIGHVYEGLLEYKVERVPVLTVGLIGSAKVKRPTMSLRELESLVEDSASKAAGAVAKVTGRSKPAITKTLMKDVALEELPPLVHACGGDEDLARRLLPFAALMRSDSWAVPLVYGAGSFAVTLGEGRRESGSHYTPKALTEPIVATTLRPILEGMGRAPTADQLLALKVCDPAMGSGAFLVEVCRQLAAQVVEAWSRDEMRGGYITANGVVIDAPGQSELLSPELADRLVTARRLVTERCLYGVDKNPMAVDLAKLSLWLVTMAKGRPFGFLDHKLKHGDSLVGLAKTQIQAFSWNDQKRDWGPLFEGIQHSLDQANEWRRAIGDFGEFDYSEKQQVYTESEKSLAEARLVGDLCIAAFFNADNDKAREELRGQYRTDLTASRASPSSRGELEGIVEEVQGGEQAAPPLHWGVEFPEVFDRHNKGFDAIVGNPPFMHGKKISGNLGAPYRDWLATQHVDTISNSDLVAHFFRRSFALLRVGGCLGLIATNTIREGDTRATGLRFICNNGGFIYSAITRLRWPGKAAVVVSTIHISKGRNVPEPRLDGALVERITAFLFHEGGDDDPRRLANSSGMSFQGSIVLGMGFTFDDTDRKGVASPLSEMERLLGANPAIGERIRPYVGGKELNTSPTHAFHRHVIDFEDLSEADAREGWPELMRIVEQRVKPDRMKATGSYKKRWWQFGRRNLNGNLAIREKQRVLVTACGATSHLGFAFMPSGMVFANTLAIFSLDTSSAFCALQSRAHEVWARFFGSSLEDRLRYTPTDCFETFPFPSDWQNEPTLEAAGKAYYEFRADLMVGNNDGLTKTYNRFHDPDDHNQDILTLRELHGAMDRAVLDAYGWKDVSIDCEFLLDYAIDEEMWGDKTKPYRYRWPDTVHDEVLARLLDLNQKRYEEEVTQGLHDKKGKKKTPSRKKRTRKKQVPKQAVPSSAVAPPLDIDRAELVALGTPAAKEELRRRGLDPLTGKEAPQGDLFS